MKVYLAGSISSGRDFREGLLLIAKTLKGMGHEISSEEFVVNINPTDLRKDRDDEAIYRRDMDRITCSRVFIAEVSQASHGVGYEHREAELQGKLILFLRHMSLSGEAKKSSFLTGTGYAKLRFAYYDETNIALLLEKFFSEFFSEDKEGKLIVEHSGPSREIK